ncbi:hypothetical protein [Synoicihabitans lomoniglobus]|uniref:Nucleotide-diphospho-sugar transferase domain-containing protein n=1 Tax=Synoicihabitans lomoniglobus TaxID=2909285 RepID=A0AAF0CQA5_9BACT|nr:hypothetical protein [Opitutaceae bacterium LMO-M01]WED66066.1 hypothetical protein PXH66_04295 [Opitutaceae bacterium LMO-M01]
MRWFFALNEASASFWDYANLVQVAVHSARTRTSLQPVCLYDGNDNQLTAWLEATGVRIIRRRTFLYQWVTELGPIPRGAYLRLEIPAICQEQGWDDTYVLYTDCDVVFRRDPAPLLRPLEPKFFAAAPESDRTDFDRFNSGVMWINVAGLAAEHPALQTTIRAHLAEAIAPPYDQAALQRHFRGRTDPLPLELNWKPYWGDQADAAILHFHGPKPGQKYHVLNHRVLDYVQRLVAPAYFTACAEWDALLIDALTQQPWPTDAAAGIADGFGDSVATVVGGLGDLEGPYPESMLPAVRWGLSPHTTLEFTTTRQASHRFEAVLQISRGEQTVVVQLNGAKIAHLTLTRLNDPHALSIDLPPTEGPQRIEILYAHGFRPEGGDPRELAVLYRALRVRTV